MRSLKINHNVLDSRVPNECEHDSLYVSKARLVINIHTQSRKINASKIKVQSST